MYEYDSKEVLINDFEEWLENCNIKDLDTENESIVSDYITSIHYDILDNLQEEETLEEVEEKIFYILENYLRDE